MPLYSPRTSPPRVRKVDPFITHFLAAQTVWARWFSVLVGMSCCFTLRWLRNQCFGHYNGRSELLKNHFLHILATVANPSVKYLSASISPNLYKYIWPFKEDQEWRRNREAQKQAEFLQQKNQDERDGARKRESERGRSQDLKTYKHPTNQERTVVDVLWPG